MKNSTRKLEAILILILVAVFMLLRVEKTFANWEPLVFQEFSTASVIQKGLDSHRRMVTRTIEEQVASSETDSTRALVSKSKDGLSFFVRIEGKTVKFRLENQGQTPHVFHNSLKLGSSGVPRQTWIQVRMDDGSLFDEWAYPDEDSWSPNYLSNSMSDIAIRMPAELETLDAGDHRELHVPLESFFDRSGFDRKTPGCRVRVVSTIYLDARLNECLKVQTDWVPLVF